MRIFLLLFLALVAVAVRSEQAAPATPASVTTLAPVMVSGQQPGPGLWKVTSPDGHVLWVLGTLDPLPRHMQWQSHEVLDRLMHSQELLLEPGIGLKAKLGFFGKLALLPRLIGVRNNPDHALLKDSVPPADYARWLVLKARFIGRDRKVEKWRPLFAGFELYESAIKDAGMDRKGVVPLLVEAAKHEDIKRTPTHYVIRVDDPRALVKEFKRERLDDVACFEAMLDRVQTDVARMGARANAWATGDLLTLRQLANGVGDMPCRDAVSGADFARKLGLADVEAKVRQAWLTQARRALAANQTTFALLPIGEALQPDGYLQVLATDGNAIEPADGADDAP
ncbi:TraB/GumN family protein [Frateuria sp. GZRR33]|uniref:TraB/GumN family protein n=1 Tax=Frateuria sp. GZRR33 TaxID=3351535 RepID=UPI003EDC6CA7